MAARWLARLVAPRSTHASTARASTLPNTLSRPSDMSAGQGKKRGAKIRNLAVNSMWFRAPVTAVKRLKTNVRQHREQRERTGEQESYQVVSEIGKVDNRPASSLSGVVLAFVERVVQIQNIILFSSPSSQELNLRRAKL